MAPSGIEGVNNPTLSLEAGKEYKIIWHNVDEKAHNVIIEDAEENNLVRTEIITTGTQEFTFTATPEMTSYYCEVHPSGMRGDVEVSGELEETTTTTTTTTTEETTTTEDTTTQQPSGEVHEVAMQTDGDEYIFDPMGLQIESGDTVRWVNESGSHSATAYEDRIPDGEDAFDSGILTEDGATFEHTFTESGTVDYYCTPHKQLGMLARIVVDEPGGPAEGSMPPDGDVPSSDRIVEEESVSWDAFQSGGEATTEGGDGETATETPGFGIGSAIAAVGAGALLKRYRSED